MATLFILLRKIIHRVGQNLKTWTLQTEQNQSTYDTETVKVEKSDSSVKEEAVEVAANLHQFGILLQDALGSALPNSACTLSGQGADESTIY